MSVLDLQTLSSTQCTLGVCGVALTLHLLSKILRAKQLPLPPGPKPLPIIGNALDFPTPAQHEGEFWAKHKALYGPISSVTIMGQTVIIINDHKVAMDLLDKRSSIYSDRPVLTFAGEMVSLGKATTLQRYDDTLRLHRKCVHNFIGTRNSTSQYESIEEVESRRFLLRVLDDPENLLDHIRTLPGAIILMLSHGYSVGNEGDDPLVELADYVINTITSESFQAGRWLVDTIPILKYVPAWMPGAGFKRTALKWYEITQQFYEKPYAFVKHEMASGKAIPSFSSKMIEDGIAEQYGEDMVKHIASTLYGAGADTTVISLKTFFIAMLVRPDVFKRAQEEVDRVVGYERLPSFTDRPNLPYIEAIVKETLRWQTVVPAGILHVTTEEDVYKGFRIPKGAMVLPIQWQMSHDPEIYPEPFVFKPERFLEDGDHKPELDPRLIAFGFGRRICPGKDLAVSSMFIAIAMIAAVFDISKAKDESGQEIEVVCEFIPGFISQPKPFKCSLKPRSDQSVSLIRSVMDEHPFKTEMANTIISAKAVQAQQSPLPVRPISPTWR